jgi:NAD(P)H-dependent flavin oxidoreductase YrpB (nitropropane dioxygenase family)
MKTNHPVIIQGGMGIAVSDWKLAKTVSEAGQLGVVSGTAINSVLVRRLQDGDKEGHVRRALRAFPSQEIAEQILASYFIEGGKEATKAYKRPPLFSVQSPKPLLQLNVVASFVEVFLAKEGHRNPVGLNLLEKVLLPNLSAIYGGLLAGVDYVIMGAGIPREIPGALDLLSQSKPASLKVHVEGSAPGDETLTTFDPAAVMNGVLPQNLKRPFFFPIVSSSILAANLKKKATGEINGFIVEGPLAGGHNAPPRGPMKIDENGEPIYGPRDVVDLKEMAELGLPFWLAGYYATPEKLAEVQAQGAHGIQVGTLFAFSQESGLMPDIRDKVVSLIVKNDVPPKGLVFTDPLSSPTGFPFKAVRLSNTISQPDLYEKRKRICDLGYLRHAYKKEDGTIGQRCPAEPVEDYVKKGGKLEDTVGRKCLCNALMADIGMPQIQSGGDIELPMLTAGDDLNFLGRILKPGQLSYSALDVLHYLLK